MVKTGEVEAHCWGLVTAVEGTQEPVFPDCQTAVVYAALHVCESIMEVSRSAGEISDRDVDILSQ